MSFNNVNAAGNGFQLGGFTGKNYSIPFGPDRYWHDLEFTALYTVVTVTVEIVLGILVALVLERLTIGRGWLMALLLWALITVVSAQLWAYIYNSVYGVLDAIMNTVGAHNLNVLGTPMQAAIAMGVADVWKSTPFVAIMVLACLVTSRRAGRGDRLRAARVRNRVRPARLRRSRSRVRLRRPSAHVP